MRKLTDASLSEIKNYWFTHGTVCGLKDTLTARTGYTGEDGFEIYVPSDVATSEARVGGSFGSGPGIWHRSLWTRMPQHPAS